MRAVLLILALALPLSACVCQKGGAEMDEDDYYVESKLEAKYSFCDDVVLDTDEKFKLSALPDHIEATITNLTDKYYNCASGLSFERKIGDVWYEFPLQGSEDATIFLDKYASLEYKKAIAPYHERIDAGLYRIVGFVSPAQIRGDSWGIPYIVACEFVVE